MKRLIALMAISAFVLQANAVTASNTSTAEAPSKQAQKRHVINTMTVPVESSKPAQAQAPEAELTLDDNALLQEDPQAASASASLETTEAQQIITRVENKPVSEKNFYLTGTAGIGAYPEVNNITGSGSVNLGIGYLLNDTWMFELGAGYGLYRMDTINFNIANRRDNFDVNQYSAQLSVRYRITEGPIVPNIGPVVSYTQRQFTLTNPFTTNPNAATLDAGTTTATDAGLVAGLEYELSDSVALGLDLRYMFNISSSAASNTNVNTNTFTGATGPSIERLQYYNAGISARMNF